MSENKEIWRPVVGYEGYYEVSNTKKVRSVDRLIQYEKFGQLVCSVKKGKELKQGRNPKTDYMYVILSKNGDNRIKHVHRLVAFAFPEICGEYFEGAVVDHLDWDHTNNVPENLRWVSFHENARRRKPTAPVPKISKTRPISVENIKTGRIDYFLKRKECAVFLGFAHTSQICFHLKTGKPYKHTFVIRYLDDSDEKSRELRRLN